MTRTSWPAPGPTATVHFVGDLHFGAFHSDRRDKIITDLASRQVPTPLAHVLLGDCTNTGQTDQDDLLAAWAAKLPAEWHAIVGNHDVEHGGRTGTQAAAAWGRVGNWSVHVGPVTIIGVSPSASCWPNSNATVLLSTETVDWLDAEIAAATNGVVVACHAPLYNTVGDITPSVGDHTSTSTGFFVVSGEYANASNGVRDSLIRSMLDTHDNVRLWASAHTHSPMRAASIAGTVDLGANTIGHLNASAPAYVGSFKGSHQRHDPIRTPFVTFNDETMEVRWRDHGAGVWLGPSGRVSVLHA